MSLLEMKAMEGESFCVFNCMWEKWMSKYEQVIEWVFQKNYQPGDVRVRFTREELVDAHDALGLPRTKNIGDIPYTFRFRRDLPASILATAPSGSEWIITGTGIRPSISFNCQCQER